MLGDSREGILFPETSYYKKINANGLMKIMNLPYLMRTCQKGAFSQDRWEQWKCRCSSNWGALISLLVSGFVRLFNVH